MRTRLILASLLALPLFATTTARVIGTSANQIVVKVTTDQPGNCTYRLSESPTLTPLSPDVDTALFAGSNSDARDGARIDGGTHIMVFGTRTTDTALNGSLVVRTLPVETMHYGDATCGIDAAVPFRAATSTLPLGDSWNEGPVRNSDGPGFYGWPTINWRDKSVRYLDPRTGVAHYRITGPGEILPRRETKTFNFALDPSAGWTNPSNALSGSTASLASTAGTTPLFVGLSSIFQLDSTSVTGWTYNWTIDDIQERLFGSGSDADPANRTATVCPSTDDGQTCYSPAITYVFPQATAAAVSAPATGTSSTFPDPPFGRWGKIIPRGLIAPSTGTLTVNGTTITAQGSQSQTNRFQLDWTPGTKIYIPTANPTCANNYCTIASVTSSTVIQLVEDISSTVTGATATIQSGTSGLIYTAVGTGANVTVAYVASGNNTPLSVSVSGSAITVNLATNASGTITSTASNVEAAIEASAPASALVTVSPVSTGAGVVTAQATTPLTVPWTSANFGLRIVKTTAVGTLNISASMEVAASKYGYQIGQEGGYPTCGPSTTTSVDASGNALATPKSGWPCVLAGTDGQAGKALYFITEDGERRYISPMQEGTMGSGVDTISLLQTSSNGGFGFIDSRNFALFASSTGGRVILKGTYSGDWSARTPVYSTAKMAGDGITWVNLTPAWQGKDLATQVTSILPWFNTTNFPSFSADGVFGNYYLIHYGIVNFQDYPCVVAAFDLTTGLITTAMDTFSTYPGRWGTCHTVFAQGQGNWAIAGINSYTPFSSAVTQIDKGGGWVSNTAIASGDGMACPANSYGATGNNCLKFRLSTNTWTVGGRSISVAAGDQITTVVQTTFAEHFLVILPPVVNSPTDTEVTVMRRAYCTAADDGASETTINGWTAYMAVTNGCRGAAWWWDVSGATPGWKIDDNTYNKGHVDIGVTAGSTTGIKIVTSTVPYLVRQDPSPLANLGNRVNYYSTNGNPTFGGFNPSPAHAMQNYPSVRQFEASDADKRWHLDFRHANGSGGSGPEIPSGQTGTASATLSAPVAGTSSTYLVTNFTVTTSDRKKAPFIGFSGRYLLQDRSGPSCSISDATPYSYGIVGAAGECVAGSTVGQVYVSLPQATSGCNTNQMQTNYTCLAFLQPTTHWAVQHDSMQVSPSGQRYMGRRITMALTGPGRQYAYSTLRALPNGKWATTSGFLMGSPMYRTEALLVKLPSWPKPDGIDRSTWIPHIVRISARPGKVVAKFGYRENGASTSYYCMSRSESCVAASSTISQTTPYLWASEVTSTSGVDCTSGCTLTIPAVSGKALYYELFDQSGGVLTAIPHTAAVALTP